MNFSRYEKAGEWLGVFDTFNSAMYSDGDFDLSPYLPFLLVSFFPLFQERGVPTIDRSHADWEVCQLNFPQFVPYTPSVSLLAAFATNKEQ